MNRIKRTCIHLYRQENIVIKYVCGVMHGTICGTLHSGVVKRDTKIIKCFVN